MNQPPAAAGSWPLRGPLADLSAGTWDHWRQEIPLLLAVESPVELRAWLREATPAQSTAVLCGLARLAHYIDGGDDPVAVAVLAWLLAGITAIARDHSPGVDADDFDDHIAQVLRTIPWRAGPQVPAHVLAALTRAGREPGRYVLPPRRAVTGWDQPPLY